MPPLRKTKIVITMGPAIQDRVRLREILLEADAVRLNASHGDPEARAEALSQVRSISSELGRHIAVFLDLQGPKWRVGMLDEPVLLEVDSVGVLYPSEMPAPSGFPWTAPLPHPELFAAAKPGQIWLLDDGALKLEVVDASGTGLKARVLVGGLLKSRKGVHPVGLDVAMDPLTEKDLADIEWGVKHDVDLFAQSFVRRASDVRLLHQHIQRQGGSQPVIAKIEHPLALANLSEILDISWGVMVARGDLGVELGVECVPGLQKRIIHSARHALKPVITATQMLESMIASPQPTRAEASDVANAIWDGTDAVMLSAESATGQYPVEAVHWLARIATEADSEVQLGTDSIHREPASKSHGRADISVAFSACRTAEEIQARWIVAFTEGGGSARMVSRLAGQVPVLGATTDLATARRMGLLRGVEALIIPRMENTDEMVEALRQLLLTHHELNAGDQIVMTMGLPLWKSGSTNTMKVMTF